MKNLIHIIVCSSKLWARNLLETLVFNVQSGIPEMAFKVMYLEFFNAISQEQ